MKLFLSLAAALAILGALGLQLLGSDDSPAVNPCNPKIEKCT